jgi:DNA invertase Pin-like site-specific DNA recombinase
LSVPLYGYARVSAKGQTLDAQLKALRAAGCIRVFREKMTGAIGDRAELRRALDQLCAGDVLVVTRLDRLARSTRDLLNTLDAITGKGAGFRSLADTWADTTAPHRRLTITVIRGLAEFERELIRVRTGDGRERARARGQHMGRRPTLTPRQRADALEALSVGTATQADLARRFAVSQSTISRLATKAVDMPRRIDADTERAVRVFLKRLKGKYAVTDAILYGSRARGDHKPDSDADIAVVLKGTPGDRTDAALDMAGIAFHVLMETGVMVQGFPLWPEELAHPDTFSNPNLIRNILRDGIHL